jgi:hypothetical protein
MEIPAQARKCPHCHHFQNRWTMILFHPAFSIGFAFLPLAAILTIFASVFDRGKDYEVYKGQIHVTGSQIVFGDTKAGATVAVIGTIANASHVSWREIQFHVNFLDAAGHPMDVGDQQIYSFALPAGETSTFKLSFKREFPEANYITAIVVVVGARDMRARW